MKRVFGFIKDRYRSLVKQRLPLVSSEFVDQSVPCPVKVDVLGIGLVQLINQAGTGKYLNSGQKKHNIAQETILR